MVADYLRKSALDLRVSALTMYTNMATIVNGKEIASVSNSQTREKIEALKKVVGRSPKLLSIKVGESLDAQIYMNMQKKAAEAIGIEFEVCKLNENITEKEFIKKIEKLNKEKSITAIIVQKPLPSGISHDKIISSIRPEKDAEGIHPYNLGKILRREADIVPCTPGAIMKILSEHNISLYGKEVVIVGHSANVGKPLSLMMLNEMATVTVCHIATAERGNLEAHTKRSDILIVAVGRPEMVRGDWIKAGSAVIDVGINKVGDEIKGDVCFKEACEHASLVTPVPGGVGPITVSILMRNVLRAFRQQNVKS